MRGYCSTQKIGSMLFGLTGIYLSEKAGSDRYPFCGEILLDFVVAGLMGSAAYWFLSRNNPLCPSIFNGNNIQNDPRIDEPDRNIAIPIAPPASPNSAAEPLMPPELQREDALTHNTPPPRP